MIIEKNLFMTVSTGRCGTGLLAKLFKLALDCRSEHEPEPRFNNTIECVRTDISQTRDFLLNEKLPRINRIEESNYVETSHLFCKGPFDIFIEQKIPIHLLILNREPREVATSMWRIRSIPGRVNRFRQSFLFHPEQAECLQLDSWERMQDYELCYWYCLETERRKTAYVKICEAADINVTEFGLSTLLDREQFFSLCAGLGLKLVDSWEAQYAEITSRKVNSQRTNRLIHNFKSKQFDYEAAERNVWQHLGEAGRQLYGEVARRYDWQ